MRCMLITTCCESHVVSSNACEEVYFVNGHFTSSSGGCGGLRNPFPKILYPPSLVPQNFVLHDVRAGVRAEKTCEAKCFICLE